MSDRDECPSCGSSWLGPEIPKDHQNKYYGGKTHFKREYGIEVRGKYDGVSYWQCPDCKATFDRWTWEIVELEQ